MGNTITASRLLARLSKQPYRVILQGPNDSGTTTMLYQLKLGVKVETVMPTIGFNVESINMDGNDYTIWDLGGRSKMRSLFHHYYAETDAFIYVVDSAAEGFFLEQGRDEFHYAMSHDDLKDVPLLIFCNKQDLPNAKSPQEIREFLGVDGMKNKRPFLVTGCVATKTNDEGMRLGLKWLTEVLQNQNDKKNEIMQQQQQQKEDETQKVGPLNHVKSFLEYDPVRNNETLKHFAPIKNGTACPFAKASKLWGGASVTSAVNNPSALSIEDQAKLHVPAFIEFVRRSNQGDHLDGFCIELHDSYLPHSKDPRDLGECTRRMLTALADLDPSGETNIMRVKYIGSKGWRFRFNKADFFITTFAPCYPKSSSRYAFGTNRAFILFQPETSFVRHDLPPDTSHTNWGDDNDNNNSNKMTIRDKTRIAFRDAGQSYFIPPSIAYPMAEHIVKPICDDGTSVVGWWCDGNKSSVATFDEKYYIENEEKKDDIVSLG